MTNKTPFPLGWKGGRISNSQYANPSPKQVGWGRSPLRFRAPGPQLRPSLAKRCLPAIVGKCNRSSVNNSLNNNLNNNNDDDGNDDDDYDVCRKPSD